jgi:tRNA-specific 2-thiouridylase
MDNIKKFEGSYNPDNKDRKEKVVLGLTTSIESLVSAYLLKIQKYDLIAVTIVNSWESFQGEQEQILSCHLTPEKLSFLKDFCHKLGIPHFLIELREEFHETVIEKWISDKVVGQTPNQCWNCHDLRMWKLYLKKQELGATYLATGHYGKVFNSSLDHIPSVHSSNDEHFDQSHLLARLSSEILSSLLLPLADISSKEVLKLAENFGIESTPLLVKFNQCLKGSKEVDLALEKGVAKSLIKDGEVLEFGVKQSLLRHEGVHHHQIGEPLSHKDQQMDPSKVMGEYSFTEKNIILIDESLFFRDKIVLINCQFSKEIHFSEPLKAAIKMSNDLTVDCWVFPKTLSTVYVELTEKVKIGPNQIVTILKKKGRNAKILLSGEIKFHLADLVKEGEQHEGTSNPLLDF